MLKRGYIPSPFERINHFDQVGNRSEIIQSKEKDRSERFTLIIGIEEYSHKSLPPLGRNALWGPIESDEFSFLPQKPTDSRSKDYDNIPLLVPVERGHFSIFQPYIDKAATHPGIHEA
jgi:hypothetical protein